VQNCNETFINHFVNMSLPQAFSQQVGDFQKLMQLKQSLWQLYQPYKPLFK